MDNLVKLTAKEHFICHLLLPKMVIDSDHYNKMVYAMSCLVWNENKNQHRHKVPVNSSLYNSIREEHAKVTSIKMKGRVPWNKGLTLTEDQKKNKYGIAPPNKGKPGRRPSIEEKRKMSMILKRATQSIKDNDPVRWAEISTKKSINSGMKRKVCLNGICYDSVKTASLATGLSPYKIRKLCPS